MNFEADKPLRERIYRHRQAKRRRLIFVFILILAAALWYISYNNNYFCNIESFFENVQDMTGSSSAKSVTGKKKTAVNLQEDGNHREGTEPAGKSAGNAANERQVAESPDSTKQTAESTDSNQQADAGSVSSRRTVVSSNTDRQTAEGSVKTDKDNTPVGISTPDPVKKNNTDFTQLTIDLKAYLKNFSGQYGIHYINLANDEKFGLNDTKSYIAASTVKVPLVLYLYKGIKNKTVNPEEMLTYQKSDYEEGTGKIIYGEFGDKYTIRQLCKLAVEYSDNAAVNMLLRRFGRKNLKDFMINSGGTVVDYNKNVSCPKDIALYMKLVYDFNSDNEVLGKELMGYFFNTVFEERISRLLPDEIEVAHKIGNQINAVHDVGIVFAEKPYVLAIMSENVNEAEAADVIANLSKKVYEYTAVKH